MSPGEIDETWKDPSHGKGERTVLRHVLSLELMRCGSLTHEEKRDEVKRKRYF